MARAATAHRYLHRRAHGRSKEILTPEGVPIRLTVAMVGDRVWALFLDLLVQVLALLALVLLFAFVLPEAGGWGYALLLLSLFIITNFYFAFFEIRWQGTTPGKRVAGIRVIDRRGGALSAEAVFARNLTRQVELIIPILILLFPGSLLQGGGGTVGILAAVWIFLLAALPLFNRDRLRVGDLVAGTMVVVAPRELLLRDLVQEVVKKKSEPEPRYAFTDEQLDIYGIYELQVLEDVLRSDHRAGREAIEVVCGKIRAKIGFEGEDVEPLQFLKAFYAAQRARLEKKMLMGERQEFKQGSSAEDLR